MAYAWWKNGLENGPAVFDYFFRSNPFDGGYTVFLGLAAIQEFLEKVRFDEESLDYLASLNGRDGEPLFQDEAFFEFLANSKIEIEIDAFREGSIVFPRQPVVRFRGPVWQMQFFEGFFLNQLNFWTLIGTKTARMVDMAEGKPISESGFRRGQGLDGHLTAALASYCAGASGTSNVLAGKLFNLPTYGTHAHSWVLFFDSEIESFTAYGKALPNNLSLLVDTFDTLEGVKVAIEVGRQLRRQGHELYGIRLDSGSLTWLSQEARKLLDAEGFPAVKIFASDSLDEYKIYRHQRDNAAIDVYAPGTALATGGNQSALGGVMKLVAVENAEGQLVDRIKLSSSEEKITLPGLKDVRRFFHDDGKMMGDAIFNVEGGMHEGDGFIVDPTSLAKSKFIPAGSKFEDQLFPAFRNGQAVEISAIQTVRNRVAEQLASLDAGVRKIDEPYAYPAGVSAGLDEQVRRAILEARRPH